MIKKYKTMHDETTHQEVTEAPSEVAEAHATIDYSLYAIKELLNLPPEGPYDDFEEDRIKTTTKMFAVIQAAQAKLIRLMET